MPVSEREQWKWFLRRFVLLHIDSITDRSLPVICCRCILTILVVFTLQSPLLAALCLLAQQEKTAVLLPCSTF